MFLECQVESDEGYQLHRHQCWELRLLPANNASFEVLHTPLSSSADPKAAGPWQAANSPATSAMTPLGPWDLLLVLQTKEVPVELPGQQWARIALQQAPQRQHKCRMIHDMYMYICKCVCIYIYQSLLDIDHVCSAFASLASSFYWHTVSYCISVITIPFHKKEKVRSHKLVVQGPMSEYVCLLIWTMLRQWIRVTIDETSGLLQISAFQRKMRRSALALKFCRSLWKFHEWDISFAHEVNRRLIVSVKTEF